MFWPTAIVLGRILVEGGAEPPRVEDQAVLLVKRHDVVVGCTPGDAGIPDDAATDAVMDGGPIDAGVADGGIGDAGPGDAGVDDTGGCTTIPGDAITMIVQPNISSTLGQMRFAVLFVTPERPIVELQSDVFRPLADFTAPVIETEIVEVPDKAMGTVCSGCGGGTTTYQGGGCGGGYGGPGWSPPGVTDAGLGDGGVIEETLGPYQFVRAQPTSTAQLAGWLDQLGYGYAQADLDAVGPYITLGFHIVAMRVALKDSSDAALTPVALTWPGSELRLPAALGRAVGGTPGTLTVYISAEQRYVMPGSTVRYAGYAGSGGYLTRSEIQLDQNQPVSADPIATHYDHGDFQEVVVVTEEKHVPVEVPCEQDSGCCDNGSPRTRIDLMLVVVAVAFALRRRR